jgi:hypothetical protein
VGALVGLARRHEAILARGVGGAWRAAGAARREGAWP